MDAISQSAQNVKADLLIHCNIGFSFDKQVVILGLCASGVAVFINESLMYSVSRIWPDMLVCHPINRFIRTITTMDRIDVFLNRLLPYTVIFVILILYVIKLLIPGASTAAQAAALPSTVRGKSTVAINSDRHIDKDIRVIVILQIIVVLLLAAPSSGIRLYNTILSFQNPLQRNMKIDLLHQVLEFVANSRCAITMLYIVPVSSTLRGQLWECIKALISRCKAKSKIIVATGSNSSEQNGDACRNEPEEV